MKAVRNARLVRGLEFDAVEIQQALVGQNVYLLYPGPDAHDCETVELDDSTTVIVVDGTWDEAQKIVYRNPVLREFPKVSFSDTPRSNYRIRRQPKDHCLSTLESMVYFLKRNADANGLSDKSMQYDGLLRAFDSMVEQQLEFWPTR